MAIKKKSPKAQKHEELNDKDINFAEGEQVKVDGDVKRVESVHKAVTVVGSSADLAYRVILK